MFGFNLREDSINNYLIWDLYLSKFILIIYYYIYLFTYHLYFVIDAFYYRTQPIAIIFLVQRKNEAS